MCVSKSWCPYADSVPPVYACPWFLSRYIGPHNVASYARSASCLRRVGPPPIDTRAIAPEMILRIRGTRRRVSPLRSDVIPGRNRIGERERKRENGVTRGRVKKLARRKHASWSVNIAIVLSGLEQKEKQKEKKKRKALPTLRP